MHLSKSNNKKLAVTLFEKILKFSKNFFIFFAEIILCLADLLIKFLSFRASVAAICANWLTLNGGLINDAAGNNAGLTMADPDSVGSLSANKAFVIDGIVPVMTSVTSSLADGNYMVGDTIPVAILFDDNVYVIGNPQISLVTFSNNTNTIVDYLNLGF